MSELFTPLRRFRPANRGFTLVELLIVVAIIGIIAAIAIPNLLSAIQRGKQKKTMGDIKTLGTALQSFYTDTSIYPGAAPGPLAAIGDGTAAFGPLWNPASQIDPTVLNPDYQVIPIWKDGWWASNTATANNLMYSPGGNGGPLVSDYNLCSFGKNGTVNAAPNAVPAGCATIGNRPYTGTDGSTFDCDISLVDGQFIQQPSGKQRNVSNC